MQSDASTADADQDRGRTVEYLERELAEARDQQAATNAILAAIATSPSDVQPVFECIVANSKRLLGAHSAVVVRVIDKELRLAAFTPTSPDADDELQTFYPRSLDATTPSAIAARDRTPFVVSDTERDHRFSSSSRELARARGYRSRLIVPMLQRGETIGLISVTRAEAAPFPAKDIALLQTFADQAVIAIENTRLLEAEQASKRELRESLEYQTAISAVLDAISRSTSQVQPVFDVIVLSCKRLLRAHSALLSLVVGDQLTLAALSALTPESDQSLRDHYPLRLDGASASVAAIRDRTPLMISDTEVDTRFVDIARQRGFRSLLIVPMMCQGHAIGAIHVSRVSPGSFSSGELELLRNFADQAVIAIENTRLFEAEQTRTRELTEALEQQTATSDILRAIGSSPHNLQSVFDAVATNAKRLLNGHSARIFTLVGDALHTAAFTATSEYADEVVRTLPPLSMESAPVSFAAVRDLVPYYVSDTETDDRIPSVSRDMARMRGWRSILVVPMVQRGRALGAIGVTRAEPGAFSEEEITLVRSFADQAVIAIENTRLFEAEQASKRELQESLEYQTATSDVLGVISRSPHTLQPVLDAIIETAARLCRADYARIRLLREGAYHVVAQLGHDPDPAERHIPLRPEYDSIVGRVALGRTTVHIPDVRADATGAYALNRHLAARTVLGVPLLKQADVVGIIMLFRGVPQAFSEREIGLVETFAHQAMIAIENTRLFEAEQASKREFQESLEYQTATGEVLNVISRSPTDVQPVFEVIARSAARLCDARFCNVFRFDGQLVHFAAAYGTSVETQKELASRPSPPSRGFAAARAILSNKVEEIPDIRLDPDYELADIARARSIVAVPMQKDGDPIGAIVVARNKAGWFPSRQVELLKTFADQAVIAIENTRLFEEVQARTRELTEALEQQTATSEILQVISNSPTEVQPVFDAIVRSASALCGGEHAIVTRYDGALLHLAAQHNPRLGADDETAKFYPQVPRRDGSISGRALLDATIVHVADIETEEVKSSARDAYRRMGLQAAIAVPMVHEGRPIGVVSVSRGTPGPFSERQIDLLHTFADQAVIAIENTRLFEAEQARTRELSESLEQQTATAEVLGVISSSPGELQPVFDGILANATRVCGASFGNLFLYEGAVLRHVAIFGAPSEFAELRQHNPVVRPAPNSILDRMAATNQPQHILDFRNEQSYLDRTPASVQLVEIAGARTVLGVPLISANNMIGTIAIYRRHIEPFTGKQIELVVNFAKQAVIAIENARLLYELRESLQQQTATADVLKSISRSTFDLPAVLDALVDSAAKLCDANDTAILQTENNSLRVVSHRGTIPSLGTASVPLVPGAVVGRAVLERRIIQVADLQSEKTDYPEGSAIADRLGFHTILAVPLVAADQSIGVITIRRTDVRPFTERQIELLQTFADQAVIAIENVRLFDEVQARTRELAKTVEDLEIASQHKSQFVANMSHELRTPLAAILGYAELMQEGFYEPLGKKSTDALTRIRSNGKHLLGLINTVLDIAKIESGQFSLNLSEYAIESVVETVRGATESLAETKKLSLKTDVTKKLPVGLGDEQRLTQVLLNLVGNAIKFTDTGEVRITATAMNGHFTVAVTDTGPGIPQEELHRVFEQFHQIDNSNTKAKGGTGLGLAIAKQIVEMHSGRIWVESTLGQGATFQMQLPIRAEAKKAAE